MIILLLYELFDTYDIYMSKKIVFSKEVEQEIIRLYTEERLIIKEIINKLNLGCSEQTISRLLRTDNISIRSIAEYKKIIFDKELEQEIIRLYTEERLSPIKIINKLNLGCSENTVINLLRTNNISIRSIAEYKKIIFDKELEQEIIRLYTEEHLSTNKIIKKLNLGCGNDVINRLLRSNNVNIRSISESKKIYFSPELEQEIIRLYTEEQLIIKEINKKLNLGCGSRIINKLLRCNNITIRIGHGSNKIRFSNEHIEEIIRLYTEEHLSVDKIINKLNLGCSEQTINRLLRRNNITIRSISESKKINIPYERLYELYIVQNKTQEQVAEECRCSIPTLINYLKKYNIVKPQDCIKETYKQTCKERLGVENPMKSKDVQEKMKQTCKERLGVEHPSQSKEVRGKYNQTVLEKYNCENVSQRHIPHDKLEILLDKDKLFNWLNSIDYEERTSSYCCKLLGITLSTFDKYIREYNIFNLINHTSSEWENEAKRWFESNYPNLTVQYNTRNIIKPYELDIFIPQLNIAIELNGSYWHSDKVIQEKKNMYAEEYHNLKEQLCKEKGITLYTIWDYDLNEDNTLEQCLKKIMRLL